MGLTLLMLVALTGVGCDWMGDDGDTVPSGSALLRGDTGEFRPTVKAILYNGHYVPVTELREADGSECLYGHYHAASGSATSTDGTAMGNPNSAGCGFGGTDQTKYDVSETEPARL